MTALHRLQGAELRMISAAIYGPRPTDVLLAAEPPEFTDEELRAAWTGLRASLAQHGEIDAVRAAAASGVSQGLMERAKDAAASGVLLDAADQWANARAAAKAAHMASLFLDATGTISLDGTSAPDEIRKFAQGLETAALISSRAEMVGAGDALDHLLEDLDRPGGTVVVTTGITELDRRMSGGLCTGTLTAILARSGHGKSSMALTWAVRAAQAKKRTLYVTREMLRGEMALRTLCIMKRQNKSLMLGYLQNERDRVAFRSDLERLPLEFLDDERDVGVICSRCIAAAEAREPYEVVVLDFIQALNGPGDDRPSQLEAMSYMAKDLALRTRAAVVILCQPSREGSREARLAMHHIRGSSSVENAVDVIVTMKRDEPITEQADYPLDLEVVKARNGEPGVVTERAWLGSGTFEVFPEAAVPAGAVF